MPRSRFAVLGAFVLSLALPTVASAQLVPPGPDVDAARNLVVKYLKRVYQPYHESIEVQPRSNREDLTLHTRANWQSTIRTHFDAYRLGTALDGRILCRGYMVNETKRIATFTLEVDGKSFMVISKDTPDGATISVAGWVRHSIEYNGTRSKTAQRPFHPGIPAPPVRSYGL